MSDYDAKNNIIQHIDDMMIGHVRRAICAHIEKYGSYDIDCRYTGLQSFHMRQFMALDDELVEQFDIQVTGVIYNTTTVDLIVMLQGYSKLDLPNHIKNGYWKLHIDDRSVSNGEVSYKHDSDLKGWQYIGCSTMDHSWSIEELETMREVFGSWISLIALSEG